MPFQALARPSLEPRTGPYLVWTTQSSIAMRLELLFHASPQVNETVGAAVPNIDRPLICVGGRWTASRGRGGAPAAQRGRTTSRPTRMRRILGRRGVRAKDVAVQVM